MVQGLGEAGVAQARLEGLGVGVEDLPVAQQRVLGVAELLLPQPPDLHGHRGGLGAAPLGEQPLGPPVEAAHRPQGLGPAHAGPAQGEPGAGEPGVEAQGGVEVELGPGEVAGERGGGAAGAPGPGDLALGDPQRLQLLGVEATEGQVGPGALGPPGDGEQVAQDPRGAGEVGDLRVEAGEGLEGRRVHRPDGQRPLPGGDREAEIALVLGGGPGGGGGEEGAEDLPALPGVDREVQQGLGGTGGPGGPADLGGDPERRGEAGLALQPGGGEVEGLVAGGGLGGQERQGALGGEGVLEERPLEVEVGGPGVVEAPLGDGPLGVLEGPAPLEGREERAQGVAGGQRVGPLAGVEGEGEAPGVDLGAGEAQVPGVRELPPVAGEQAPEEARHRVEAHHRRRHRLHRQVAVRHRREERGGHRRRGQGALAVEAHVVDQQAHLAIGRGVHGDLQGEGDPLADGAGVAPGLVEVPGGDGAGDLHEALGEGHRDLLEAEGGEIHAPAELGDAPGLVGLEGQRHQAAAPVAEALGAPGDVEGEGDVGDLHGVPAHGEPGGDGPVLEAHQRPPLDEREGEAGPVVGRAGRRGVLGPRGPPGAGRWGRPFGASAS